MPGAPTDKGADIQLDAITGRATQTARTMYGVLATADSGRAMTPAAMSEISTTGYARQTFTPATPATAATSKRRSANTVVLTWGPFTADPPNVTHVVLVSSSSGTTGDAVYRWAVDTPRDAASGDSISVAINAMTMDIEVVTLA